MNIGSRIAAWLGGKKLPYARRLAYLEGTGAQWLRIYTGSVNETFGLKARLSMVVANDNYPAGFSTTNNARFLFFGPRDRHNAWEYGWGANSSSDTYPRYSFKTTPSGLNNFHEFGLNYLNSKKCFRDDSSEVGITGASERFNNQDFLLFRSYSSPCECRFEYASLSIGSDVVLDLIPVIDLEGRPCMYNQLIGGSRQDDPSRYFYNLGSGDFLYGELDGGV